MSDLQEAVNAITGLNLVDGAIVFSEAFSETDFGRLLQLLRESVGEFTFYDPLYPSISDPGAYFSYSRENAPPNTWRMTLGNHGWSGGIYQIETRTVQRQITHLWSSGLLDSVRIKHVHFFRHRQLQSAVDNEAINARIRQLHAPLDVGK
jgi:hypothetical protein